MSIHHIVVYTIKSLSSRYFISTTTRHISQTKSATLHFIGLEQIQNPKVITIGFSDGDNIDIEL